MNTFLIVDGNNCFIRNYAALPTLDLNGEPFGGVAGFLSSLKFYINKCKVNYVVICWDGKGGSQKRRALVENYKKGRKPIRLNRVYDFQEQEDNKMYQRLKLSEYLQDLPVCQIEIDGIEADDVVGYLCFHLPQDRKIIISSDKDFYQLINSNTLIFSPIKKVFITPQRCFEELGIYPQNYLVAKSIVGDKSDNIKGINRIGFKTVTKLFPFICGKEKIEIEQLFEYCQNKDKKYADILQNKDIVITNLKAMQLENPIISPQSITKINDSLSLELSFNLTSFRKKAMCDGLMFDENFFQSFKFLKLKGVN